MSINEKGFYANILRAQLSKNELMLINYDSNYKAEEMRPLIEKYQIYMLGIDQSPIDF